MGSLGSSPSLILAGTWINLSLYTVELLAGVYYFHRVRSWKTRTLVGMLFLLDTGGTAATCHIAWVALLIPQHLETTNATYTIAIVTSALSSFILQAYFTHRLWAIATYLNNFHSNGNKILISFLVVLIMAELCCFSIGLGLHVVRTIVDKNLFVNLAIIFTSLEVAINVIIAVCLAYQLKRLDVWAHLNSTKSLIRRVMAHVIACGFFGVITVIIGTALSIFAPNGFVIFFDCIGRVYALTILLNLLFYNRRVNHRENPQSVAPANFPSQWESRRSMSGPWSQSPSPHASVSGSAGQVSRRPISGLTIIHDQNTTGKIITDGYHKPGPGPPFSVESL